MQTHIKIHHQHAKTILLLLINAQRLSVICMVFLYATCDDIIIIFISEDNSCMGESWNLSERYMYEYGMYASISPVCYTVCK